MGRVASKLVLGALMLAGCGPAGVGYALFEAGKNTNTAALEIAELLGPIVGGEDRKEGAFIAHRNPSFTVTGTRRNAVFEARLDNRLWITLRAENDDDSLTSHATFEARVLFDNKDLPDGPHVLEVRPRGAGETGTVVTRTWTIDTVPPGPQPQLQDPTTPEPREIRLAWSDDLDPDGTAVEYEVVCDYDLSDPATASRVGRGILPHVPPQRVAATQTTLVLRNLEAAVRYLVRVDAVDEAGNRSSDELTDEQIKMFTKQVRTRTGGAGSLAAPVAYPLDGPARAVRVADLDGDGAPDVVAALGGAAPGVAILLRRPADEVASAGFVLKETLPVLFENAAVADAPADPRGVLIGDLDGDEVPDVVLFSDDASSGGSVRTWRGVRAAQDPRYGLTFKEEFTSVGPVSSMVLGPLDDLGSPDLGYTIEQRGDGRSIPPPSRVKLLPASGPGSFTDPGGTGFQRYEVVAPGGSCVPTGFLEVFEGTGAHALVTAHLNDDGALDFPDLAFCDLNSVRVAYGVFQCATSAARIFTRFAQAQPYVTGASPEALAVADLDGDGRLDIAVSHGGGALAVLWGEATGLFTTSDPIPAGRSAGEVAVADFNSDGVPDLVVADPMDQKVWIVPGAGARRFGAAKAFPAGGAPTSLDVGDFNEDAIPDVVVNADGEGRIHVLFGTGALFSGSGSFVVDRDIDVLHDSPLLDLATADFDGDGDTDALGISHLTVMDGSTAVEVDLITAVRGLFASLDSPAQGDALRFAFFGTELRAHSLVVGDFFGDTAPDGILDVVAAGPGGVHVFAGRAPPAGPGRIFESAQSVAKGAADYAGLVAAHLDGDGLLDLAYVEILGTPAARIMVARGQPNGRLAPPEPVVTLATALFQNRPEMIAADFSGDGLVDLALIVDGPGDQDAYYIFERKGPLLFMQVESGKAIVQGAGGGGRPRSLVQGDFDGDGRTDLAWLNSAVNSVSVLRRRPTGSAGPGLGTGPTGEGDCYAVHGGTGELLRLQEGEAGTCVCPVVDVFTYEVATPGVKKKKGTAMLVYSNGRCEAPPNHAFDTKGDLIECPEVDYFDSGVTGPGQAPNPGTSPAGRVRLVLNAEKNDCVPPAGYVFLSNRVVVECPRVDEYRNKADDTLEQTGNRICLVLDNGLFVCPPNYTEISGKCVLVAEVGAVQVPKDDPVMDPPLTVALFTPHLFPLAPTTASRLQQAASVPGAARRLVTGDFDDDGLTDIAILNPVTAEVTVLRGQPGQGPGVLAPQQLRDAKGMPLAVNQTGLLVGEVAGVASADFNGDGVLDLVVAKTGGGLRLLVGAGELTEDPR